MTARTRSGLSTTIRGLSPVRVPRSSCSFSVGCSSCSSPCLGCLRTPGNPAWMLSQSTRSNQSLSEVRKEFHICPDLLSITCLSLRAPLQTVHMDTNPDLPRVRGSRPAGKQVYEGVLFCACHRSDLPTMPVVFEDLVWSSLESFQEQSVLVLQF